MAGYSAGQHERTGETADCLFCQAIGADESTTVQWGHAYEPDGRVHVSYPHIPGTLYDCPSCEEMNADDLEWG